MLKTHSAWTLSGRLVLIVAFTMTVTLLVGGFAMYRIAKSEDELMLDSRLQQMGAVMLGFIEHELAERADSQVTTATPPIAAANASSTYRFQVWSRDGKLLLQSANASLAEPLMPLGKLGFLSSVSGDTELRSYAMPGHGGEFVVQVAEKQQDRSLEFAQVALHYLGLLLLPFALLFAAAWLLLRSSMRSIRGIAMQLTQRNPLDVSELVVENPPAEVLPILRSVDSLFQRMRHALSAERRFTSMAAHEMKTPLAGLRAQAQLAASARTLEEAKESLLALIGGVDRSAHLLDQLLDLARMEGLSPDDVRRTGLIDLSGVLHDVIEDLAMPAKASKVTINTEVHDRHVQGHAFGMFLLMRNLLCNAIHYGGHGCQVRVTLAQHEDSFVLLVDDSGHGIAAPDRQRAFDRFNRLGQTKCNGVGLGLSIVLMVVELHGARIELLDSPLGGLRVQVMFNASLLGQMPAAGRSRPQFVVA